MGSFLPVGQQKQEMEAIFIYFLFINHKIQITMK